MVEAEFPDRSVVRPLVSPNRVLFETSDGRLLQLYMVRTHAELDALLVAAEREDLLSDPRFGEHALRPQHAPELVEELKATLRQRTAAEWMRIFRENGVPVTPVAQTQDLLHDPQVLANRIAVPPSDLTVVAPLIVNHPLNIDGLARVGPTRAPEVGEHTAEVLAELGFDAAEVAGLRARGAL
jgi:formyl-CoA transferase